METRLSRPGVLVAAIAMLAGACGGSAGSPTASATGSTTPVAPSTAASATASAETSKAPATVPPGGPVNIRWYCCLGGGEAPDQKKVEDQVVKDFNASHPNIHLTFEVVTYDQANGQLATQIQSGAGPDIVGPVGIGGANAFHGKWLDLKPLIDKTGYDLSGFPENVVDIYKLDEGQVGIPFAIYPSALFYRKGLFEEAGLNEPPHKYGEQYQMPDGSMVDWNYDTARQVAKLLTVDKNNKDATDPAFDPKKIAQWGLELQRDDLRGLGAYFGPGSLAGGDGKTVQIPEAWKAAWKFYYQSIWTDHISITGPQFESKDINPADYPFFAGNTAMSENFLWSTYGVGDLDDWDLAAIPSYNGQVTAAFNADTFRILKDTKHPDEAFEVLSYLLGPASGDLLKAYGGFPARTADQQAGIDALQSQFKNKVDWQVAVDGIQYADNPNFESFMPAYNESLGLVGSGGTYLTEWGNKPGLDMDAQIEKLRTDLQAIWDKAS
jgi:multiple sugar transport system substrate-binding protein